MLPQALLGHSMGKGQQGLISKLRAENDKVRTEKKVRLTSAWSFPGGPSGKEPTCPTGDLRHKGSIPGSGRYPRGGHDNPLQHSCLKSPMDRGAWRATVHGVAQSWTRLSDLARTENTRHRGVKYLPKVTKHKLELRLSGTCFRK